MLLQGSKRLVRIDDGPAAGCTALSRANPSGGIDCEIAVPWRALTAEGIVPGDGGVLAAAVGGAGGCAAEGWSWPGAAAYLPRYLGRIKLAAWAEGRAGVE